MKVIPQSATYLDVSGMSQEKVIESAGRTCYKSEDKITEDSANNFAGAMERSGHLAMIEFGYIYMKITEIDFCEWFYVEKPSFIHMSDDGYVVGNFRAFYDWFKAWLNHEVDIDEVDEMLDLAWCLQKMLPTVFKNVYDELCKEFDDGEPEDDMRVEDIAYPFKIYDRETFITDYMMNASDKSQLSHLIPHIVKFVTDRGISHEIVRHRRCSFAQESTRYCDYSKDKFDKQITVIEPTDEVKNNPVAYEIWKESNESAERHYFELRGHGVSPQSARDVLPTTLKTEIYVCAFEEEWQHMINLRLHETTGPAHPKIKALMGMVYPDLVKHSEGRIK